MNNVMKSIGWADFTVNSVKGKCPMNCSYCYAIKFYNRKPSDIFKDPTIRWDEKAWQDFKRDLQRKKKPVRIFVGSTIELFGDWIKPEWLKTIFDTVKEYPQHTFIFLTKQPQNLIKYSPYPENCWVGMSVDTMSRYGDITDTFSRIKATVKFVSFEPMLDYTPPDLRYVDWVIVGQQTPSKLSTQPKREWIIDLVKSCDKAKIPVFLKDNLNNILPWEHPLIGENYVYREFRQEFPSIKDGE